MRQADVIKRRNLLWPVYYTPPGTVLIKSHVSFLDRASDALGVPKHILLGQDRRRAIARQRHAIYHVMRLSKGMSYPQIGRIMNRDHSTIIYGVRNSLNLITRDDGHKNIVDTLEMVA